MIFGSKGSDREKLKLLKPFKLSMFLSTYLVEHMKLREFGKDESIIKQGEPGSSMFLIGSGALRVLVGNNNGDEIQVGLLGRGDYFGEMTLLENRPRIATVIAQSNSHVYEILHTDLENLLRDRSEIYRQLKDTMTSRHQENRKRLGVDSA